MTDHSTAATTVRDAGRYHHGDLRHALVESTLVAIAEGGVEVVSVRSLSRAIGVTHRAAAAHFRSKQDLVAAALARGYERLADELDGALRENEDDCKAMHGRTALVRVALAYGAFARTQTALFLAMNGTRLNADGDRPEPEQALQSAFSIVVKAARADGHAEPEEAALHFWACLQGVLVQCALGRIRVAPERWDGFVALTARRIVGGLAAG